MNYNPEKYWSSIYDKGVNAKSVCYPDWPLNYNQFLHQQQIDGLLKILKTNKLDLKGKSILEIGPGSGFWTSFFESQKVGNYVGVELNPESFRFLGKTFPKYLFFNNSVSDSSLYDSLKDSYDVIYVAMVLLHITDEVEFEKAIALLKTKLKPNGVIIILDSIASKNVYGQQKFQTEGELFDSTFHNKIRKESTYRNVLMKNYLIIDSITPAFNSSQMCFDFSNYLSYLFFGKLFYAIHRRILKNANETTSSFYIRIIRKFDLFLTKTLNLSMSSKWLIIKNMVH